MIVVVFNDGRRRDEPMKTESIRREKIRQAANLKSTRFLLLFFFLVNYFEIAAFFWCDEKTPNRNLLRNLLSWHSPKKKKSLSFSGDRNKPPEPQKTKQNNNKNRQSTSFVFSFIFVFCVNRWGRRNLVYGTLHPIALRCNSSTSQIHQLHYIKKIKQRCNLLVESKKMATLQSDITSLKGGVVVVKKIQNSAKR